jgi:hypothetical protein
MFVGKGVHTSRLLELPNESRDEQNAPPPHLAGGTRTHSGLTDPGVPPPLAGGGSESISATAGGVFCAHRSAHQNGAVWSHGEKNRTEYNKAGDSMRIRAPATY